jgi:hypothetical protein
MIHELRIWLSESLRWLKPEHLHLTIVKKLGQVHFLPFLKTARRNKKKTKIETKLKINLNDGLFDAMKRDLGSNKSSF